MQLLVIIISLFSLVACSNSVSFTSDHSLIMDSEESNFAMKEDIPVQSIENIPSLYRQSAPMARPVVFSTKINSGNMYGLVGDAFPYGRGIQYQAMPDPEPPPKPVLNREVQMFFVKQKMPEKPEKLEITPIPTLGAKLKSIEISDKPKPIKPIKPTMSLPDTRIPNPLDILFVMDTSDSMHANLLAFKKKFWQFLIPLMPLDWRWGITNADAGDSFFFLFNLGSLKGSLISLEFKGSVLAKSYLDRNTPDKHRVFLDTVSMHEETEYYNEEWSEALEDDFIAPCDLPPYCQSYQEQPVKALAMALTKNQNFFRSNANLAAVIITNSQERSFGSTDVMPPAEVVKIFHQVHGRNKKFKVYSIVVLDGDENCIEINKDSQWFFPEGSHSYHAAELTRLTGGEIFNICAENYKHVANRIYADFQ